MRFKHYDVVRVTGMRKLVFITVVAIATVLLSACDARYRDVSSNQTQKALVGQVCEVVANLRAHGVTLRLEREKKTEYISIWNPGFTGPEVTFISILAPGTKLHLLAARECVNCPFDRVLEYEVKVRPEPAQFAGKPAFIQAESLTAFVRCPNGNAAPPAS
jgi:hypothetical protein